MATHSLVTMPVVSHSQKRKKCAGDGVQVQRPVRLGPVQEDGDGRDRDVGHDQRESEITPPRQVQETVRGEGKPVVTH